MAKADRDTVVFDLGGVLIKWDPRHLYRKLFPGDEPAMERFLAEVCTHDWNRCQDAGRSFAFCLDPRRVIYDDAAANIAAALPFGIRAIWFTSPAALREELVALGLLQQSR